MNSSPAPPPDTPDLDRPGWLDRLLRWPLRRKILVANAAALGLATGVGAWLASRPGGPGGGPPAWALVAGAASAGVLFSAAFDLAVLRLALSPLAALERAAARIGAGGSPETNRVPDQPLADRDLERLIRVFNHMVDGLARHRRRLRELAVRAMEAGEAERRRVARQLQDDTAQRLASLLVNVRLARRADDPEERDRRLEAMRAETADVLEAVRRIARGLHPPELDEIGVDRAVRAFVRGLWGPGGPETELDLAPVEDCLDEEARRTLYRILQEALINVHDHARADRVAVRIARGRDRVVGEVVDDGVGLPRDLGGRHREGESLGLLGMRERARHAGGRLSLAGRPGAGTRVRVELPRRGNGSGEAADGPPAPDG